MTNLGRSDILRTPHNQMPVTLSLTTIQNKMYRDIYCIECGRPFITMTDKFITIIDAAIPVKLMRGQERVIEARCSNHYCKQYFHMYV